MKCVINAHGVICDSLEGQRKGRRQDSSTPRQVRRCPTTRSPTRVPKGLPPGEPIVTPCVLTEAAAPGDLKLQQLCFLNVREGKSVPLEPAAQIGALPTHRPLRVALTG